MKPPNFLKSGCLHCARDAFTNFVRTSKNSSKIYFLTDIITLGLQNLCSFAYINMKTLIKLINSCSSFSHLICSPDSYVICISQNFEKTNLNAKNNINKKVKLKKIKKR